MTDITTPEQGELPAGFTVETCIVVSCRTCDRVYGDEEEGVTVHFTSTVEAVKAITEASWWITQQGIQCQYCAAAEACLQLGHAWQEWKPCPGVLAEHPEPMEYRTCAGCGEWDERVAQATDEQ